MVDELTKLPEDCADLQELRAVIDQIDRQVIVLIGQRAGYVQAAARFKNTSQAVQAEDRVKTMLVQRRVWASEAGLKPDVIEKLYYDLIQFFVGEEMTYWKQSIKT